MNGITGIAFTLSLITATATAKENPVTLDEAEITTIVESVAALADRSEFDALARLYADSFTLDYSTLSGEAATTKKPLQLMTEWASVLPGFDRTRHALSDIVVEVSGNKATASANVVASHWIGDGFWQVGGRYDYMFAETGGHWKITSMTFTLESEKGSRDVFGPAIAAASSKNIPGHNTAIAERNKTSVRTFFDLLESENIPAFVDLFAENGVQKNPFNGGIFPTGARGKGELMNYWEPVPSRFDGMRFVIEEMLATEDPDTIYVRYRGEITLKNNAGLYSNNYYSTFRFDADGKITEYVEIFDPVVAARGFGLLDQLK